LVDEAGDVAPTVVEEGGLAGEVDGAHAHQVAAAGLQQGVERGEQVEGSDGAGDDQGLGVFDDEVVAEAGQEVFVDLEGVAHGDARVLGLPLEAQVLGEGGGDHRPRRHEQGWPLELEQAVGAAGVGDRRIEEALVVEHLDAEGNGPLGEQAAAGEDIVERGPGEGEVGGVEVVAQLATGEDQRLVAPQHDGEGQEVGAGADAEARPREGEAQDDLVGGPRVGADEGDDYAAGVVVGFEVGRKLADLHEGRDGKGLGPQLRLPASAEQQPQGAQGQRPRQGWEVGGPRPQPAGPSEERALDSPTPRRSPGAGGRPQGGDRVVVCFHLFH